MYILFIYNKQYAVYGDYFQICIFIIADSVDFIINHAEYTVCRFSKPHATNHFFMYTNIQIIYNFLYSRELLLILYQYLNTNILKPHLNLSSLAVILNIV